MSVCIDGILHICVLVMMGDILKLSMQGRASTVACWWIIEYDVCQGIRKVMQSNIWCMQVHHTLADACRLGIDR